jgi:3-oxoacid CoA-transferase A subunit
MAFTKVYETAAAAVADIENGSMVLVGSVATEHQPGDLLQALHSTGISGLTCVCDMAQSGGDSGVDRLIASGQVVKLISSNPLSDRASDYVKRRWESGDLEVEVIPQGTLAERLRAGGAGIGGVFIPVGAGTRFAEGRETREINGAVCLFEPALKADFALLSATAADSLGNLVFQGSQRGWNQTMAAAARISVAEAGAIGEPGSIDPELVTTPGIFVNRVVLSHKAGV